jgi:RNA polymerase sigma-70 factor, ECF subfamily
LRAAFEAARAAWPDVELGAEPFATFVASKLPAGEPAERSLATLRTTELYLTCACGRGDVRAVAALERLCAAAVDRAAARAGPAATQKKDELRQQVCERLLVPRATDGAPQPPRIADFSGRGPLDAWLRVVASRAVVDLQRAPDRERPAESDLLEGALGADAGPEFAYLKRLYRNEFKAAFREALEALPGREQTLLRQHLLDGLSLIRLAALHRVHRATVARWVDAARRAVLEQTRLSLGRRLRVGADELDSVMRLVQSELDVTLSALLREGGGAGPRGGAPPGE